MCYMTNYSFTFSLANCDPLNAVRGLLSSATVGDVPFSLAGFFGLRVRGPIVNLNKNKQKKSNIKIPFNNNNKTKL